MAFPPLPPLFCALRSLSHQIFGLAQKEVRPAILPPTGILTTPKKKQTALVCACHLVMITEPRTAHIEFEKKRWDDVKSTKMALDRGSGIISFLLLRSVVWVRVHDQMAKGHLKKTCVWWEIKQQKGRRRRKTKKWMSNWIEKMNYGSWTLDFFMHLSTTAFFPKTFNKRSGEICFIQNNVTIVFSSAPSKTPKW